MFTRNLLRTAVVCLATAVAWLPVLAQDGVTIQETDADHGVPSTLGESESTSTGITVGTAADLSVFSVLRFSGRMLKPDGTPRTGTVGLTFAFYGDQSGGTPLWVETQNVTLDPDGGYAVLLGSHSAKGLPLEMFAAGEARWLGVHEVAAPEQPRILLVTVPYAMKAAEAERLGGRAAEDFVLSEDLEAEVRTQVDRTLEDEKGLTLDPTGPDSQVVKGEGTPGRLARFTEPRTVGNSVVFEDSLTGNVGVGTVTPVSALEVAGIVTATGFLGDGSGLTNLSAVNADTLDGLDSAQFARLDSANEFAAASVFRDMATRTTPLVFVRGALDEDGVAPLDALVKIRNDGDGFGLRVESEHTSIDAVSSGTTGFKAAVAGTSAAEHGRGLFGRAMASLGTARGVEAYSAADMGYGVLARAAHPTGATTGIGARVDSPAGTAAIFTNTAGGKLVSANGSAGEVFSVAGDGTVTATVFVGDGSQLTGIGGAGGDADTLDGLDSTEFARLNGGNAFTGNQLISGDVLIASGGGGLRVLGAPASGTQILATANVIGGFTGNEVVVGFRGATISGGGGMQQLATEDPANRVTGNFGTVSGGSGNSAATFSVAGGGRENSASGGLAVVAGGHRNLASGAISVVGGGEDNRASGNASTISGGQGNFVDGASVATIAGGANNIARGNISAVAGGAFNTTAPEATSSVIMGGEENHTFAHFSAIAGGYMNTTHGPYAFVAGGQWNEAAGVGSFAGGSSSRAGHEGSFVWGDHIDVAPMTFNSSKPNEFSVRARGGFRFVTGVNGTLLPTAGVFIDTAGGKLLSGLAGGAETFSVTNDGTVTASRFVGDGSALINLPPTPLRGIKTIFLNLLSSVTKSGARTGPNSGVLAVDLPQGASLKTLRVCGRDDDSTEENITLSLLRKPLTGGDVLADAVTLATVESGIAFASTENLCFEIPLTETVDNSTYFYMLEMTVTGPADYTVGQIEY